jgi:Flp pilus assembly protein TadD
MKKRRNADQVAPLLREADRDLAEAHGGLGVALDNLGKRDEAIAELRKARDNAPRGAKFAPLIEKLLNAFDH